MELKGNTKRTPSIGVDKVSLLRFRRERERVDTCILGAAYASSRFVNGRVKTGRFRGEIRAKRSGMGATVSVAKRLRRESNAFAAGNLNSVVPYGHGTAMDKETHRMITELRVTDLTAVVHHYMPGVFPLSPSVGDEDVRVMNDSWLKVQSGTARGLCDKGDGLGGSGLVRFFDEFYQRLFARSKKYESIFGSNIRARGEIMLRILQFVCTLDLRNPSRANTKLFYLGRAHAHRNIRPFQYGIFAETLIETMMDCLGDDGTYTVASAWTRVMSYVMLHILPEAIKGCYVETEFATNYSSNIKNKSLSMTATLVSPRSSGGEMKSPKVSEFEDSDKASVSDRLTPAGSGARKS